MSGILVRAIGVALCGAALLASCSSENPDPENRVTAYVTKVLDFMPAVGQYVNVLPEYTAGDTQETMNRKVLEAIGDNRRGTISLGGFGGYVVVGFDHTIENREGLRDFRVLGNAFYAANNPDASAPKGGSSEPGVIWVAYDKNKNGLPDDDEWYEIAGSSYTDASDEAWYRKAIAAGNDVEVRRDYKIIYYRPEAEPSALPAEKYIRWTDNYGTSGYKAKNASHTQSYFPGWVTADRLMFEGTRLPQNGIDESDDESESYYVLYAFGYGYADNVPNTDDDSAIDIDWAVDADGQKVHLPGVDFVKICSAVNQQNGWLGECSTEVSGVEDLHVLGVSVNTRQ